MEHFIKRKPLISEEWWMTKEWIFFNADIYFLARARESFLFFSNWVVSLLNSCHCTCFEWVGNCSNLILCSLAAIESNKLGMKSGYWKLNIGVVLGISRQMGLRKIEQGFNFSKFSAKCIGIFVKVLVFL